MFLLVSFSYVTRGANHFDTDRAAQASLSWLRVSDLDKLKMPEPNLKPRIQMLGHSLEATLFLCVLVEPHQEPKAPQ